VPAVDHVKGRFVVRDVQHGGGDECLAAVLGLALRGRWVVQVRGDGSLQEGDQCGQVRRGPGRALAGFRPFLADTTVVPVGTTCCGTAGDRGLLHPELVVSATRDEKAGLEASAAQAYLSANRTCEMGLRHATGQPYESFIFPLEELTRPA
jgi:hypothetical protein